MSTPAGAINGEPRQQRQGKKSNHSSINTTSPSNARAVSQPTLTGGVETTAPNRRARKHTNPQTQNGYQGTPNGNKVKTHQRAPSQPHPASSAVQVTPSKAIPAYAGPTFHASPAPSSLPMPKMFSKSVTDSTSSLPSMMTAEDSDNGQPGPNSATASRTMTPDPKAREPSPLDFLFDAARQARSSSSQSQTPTLNSRNVTPSGEHTPTHARATPTDAAAAMFPLELDGSNEATNGIGPSFATPYQERMSAYRSRGNSSHGSQSSLDEGERLAKTEALKRLLGHQASPPPTRSPVNEYPKPATQRHSSGPTILGHISPGPNGPQFLTGSPSYNESPFRDIPVQRPASSKLRQQISPGAPERYIYPTVGDVPSPSRTPRGPVDTKKMEDDLRRVLKLDVTN